MAPLAAKSISSCSQGPSSVSEKASGNKRKFRADTPTDHFESETSTLDGLPPYEISAESIGDVHHGQNGACDIIYGGSQNHSDVVPYPLLSHMGPVDDTRGVESGDFKDVDWSELTEAQLEELVLSNLDTIFESAIKKIVAYGYTEEAATKAIMRAGISYGLKGTLSNIVENAITFLRTCQQNDISRESCFKDLHQLGRYILAELVCVLRALSPSFSNGDAMWYLLICDMNISQACTMDGETSTSNNTGNVGPSNENISTPPENKPDTEIKSLVSEIPDPCTPSASTPSLPPDAPSVSGLSNLDKSKKPSVPNKLVSGKRINSNMNAVDKPLDFSGSSQLLASEGKPNCSRTVHLSASSKRELLLVRKTFRLDKFSRAVGHKGVLRAGKISSSAGASFDRKLKSVTHSGGINHRNVSMKTSKAVAIKVPPEHGKMNPITDQPITARATGQDSHNYNAQLTLSSCIPPLSLPIDNTTASIPVAETDECLLNKPFGQFSGSDAKDTIIIKLVSRVQELQSQLDEWREWANQKVMQAARRLGKDKSELKSLRQEKEESEKLKRDKQTMDENAMKKLSEMESALSKARRLVEHANSAFQRLEVENADLRRQMEAARFQSAESAANCQKASIREKRTLMEIQSWEKQKNLFQEELVKEKRKSATILKELGLYKDVLGQVEVVFEVINQCDYILIT
uniref:PIR2-like helical domain-containing protein n=1 Tax=Kalanchoe fedtschenkoi TaxID=63787 RepID=A0A7N0TL98_KALFE